jgi:2-C-methyl-D-erythritol 4-phosphate cytidylyltransferase
MNLISVILLAGGSGSRMQTSTPKQFLSLSEKIVALYSFDLFASHPEVGEIVVVCTPPYRHYFAAPHLKFAQPGARRQDSLWNGLQQVSSSADWICIHDAARPFLTREMLDRLFETGRTYGAATLGLPLKWTVKEATHFGFVARTLQREHLWEIQTPQIVSKRILERGFALAQSQQLTVTDDVALAEIAGHLVKIVEGDEKNIKLTTPSDFLYAQWLSSKQK